MTERHQTKTVLIIEDDADVRNFASRVVELEGYRVLQTEDADKGIGLAKENPVALALLDLRLPDRDGWSVLAEMKSKPQLSEIPVIVFTASAGIAPRERALNAGVADYLVKPLSVRSLADAISRILQQRR